jgi:hypothetical protein
MPAFATIVITLVAALAEFLVLFVTKKIAFGIAAVTTLGFITIALFVTLRTVLGGIANMVSDPDVVRGIAMVVPDNVPACISAYVTVWCACTLYSWQRKALELFATVS